MRPPRPGRRRAVLSEQPSEFGSLGSTSVSTRLSFGDEQFVELELFADDVAGAEDSSQVPVGPRRLLIRPSRTGSEGCRKTTGADAVIVLRSLPGGPDRLVFEGDDDIDALADEILGLRVRLIRLEVAPDELDVLPADVAALQDLLHVCAVVHLALGTSHPNCSRSSFASAGKDGGTWSVPTCIRPTRGTSLAAELLSEPEHAARATVISTAPLSAIAIAFRLPPPNGLFNPSVMS